jgi:hypothetical protein
MISVLVIQFLDKAAFATDFETNEKIRHGMETNAVLPPMRSESHLIFKSAETPFSE